MLSLFLSVVDCSYQRVDGSTDDIRIYACAPGKDSVRLFDADVAIACALELCSSACSV